MNYSRDQIIALNRREFGDNYELFHFPDEAAAAESMARRESLLRDLASDISSGSSGTKYYRRSLSPGCRCCGETSWSCLFINGICNARCFFCPAEQTETGDPATNSIPFPDVADYADYLERFGFTGASISGGEPLMTFDRSLHFLKSLRERFAERIHLWLYTNGTLVTRDKLLRLAESGLNEIRFDLCAVDYDLDKVRLANGVIETVTVEIPAVPEDLGRLQELLPDLVAAGVRFLNLHQLRCTPRNFPELIKRPYTFLHDERITVLESESAALELIRHVIDTRLDLAVNYCSFVYKHRFQALGSRRRAAPLIVKPHEDITPAGYIRSLCVTGSDEAIGRLVERFQDSGLDWESWYRYRIRNQLFFKQELWPLVAESGLPLSVSYANPFLLPAMSYHNPYKEIRLNPNRSIVVEKTIVLPEQEVSPEVSSLADLARVSQFASFERIEPGLQQYW